MDTILRPRHVIESDSSDKEDQVSSSSSKVTVVLKEYKKCSAVDSGEIEDCNGNTNGNIIVRPTERFLRIKPKELSSYDLLVLPPKRPKFVTHSNQENMRQKINPPLPPQSKASTLECIFFENEKKEHKRKESSGRSSVSSMSASLKKSENKPLNHPTTEHEPVLQSRILSEEHQLKQCKLAQEEVLSTFDTFFNGGKFSSDGKKNDFPATDNYVFYAQWSPNNPNFNTENLRGDVNRNYLPNILPEGSSPHAPIRRNDRQGGDFLPEDRRFRKAVYRLRDMDLRSEPFTGNISTGPAIYIRGNDGIHQKTDGSLSSSQYVEQGSQIRPQSKRRKLNSIEFVDETERIKNNATTIHYKTYMEGRGQYDIGNDMGSWDDFEGPTTTSTINSMSGDNGVGDQSNLFVKPVSLMFQTLYDDDSSIYQGTPIQIISQEEFTVIHHPDLQDFRTDSILVNDCSTQENESPREQDDRPSDPRSDDVLLSALSAASPESSQESLRHDKCSPVQIFLHNSSGLPSSSSQFTFSMDGSFVNFPDFGQVEEESRVVDVTDLVPDDGVMDFVYMYENQYSNSSEMETTFQSLLDTTSSFNLTDNNPEMCQLIEGLSGKQSDNVKDDDGKVGSSLMLEVQHPAEEWEAQEVFMQPNPRIKTSTSVHSALERSLGRTSATAKLVDKQTKSDYFVGKAQGLSKSIMKMYQKHSEPDFARSSSNGNYNSTGIKFEVVTERQHSRVPVEPDVCPPTPNASPSGILACIGKTLTVLQHNSQNSDNNNKGDINISRQKETEPTSQSQLRRIFSFTKSTFSQLKPNSPIKTSNPSFGKTEAFPKPIIKRKAETNKLSKIICRLFKGLCKSKQKNDENINNSRFDKENNIPPVPPSLSKKMRRIIEHTDSRELYRGRRQRRLQEQIDFQKESLSKYVKSILQDELHATQLENSTVSITSYRSPITFFLENPISQSYAETSTPSSKDNESENRFDDCGNTVPVSVRLSKSDSAIAKPTLTLNGRSSLVLQFPPFLQVLAAIIESMKESIREEKDSELERIKEKLRKPLKGILKKT